jgi:hypothetical protein
MYFSQMKSGYDGAADFSGSTNVNHQPCPAKHHFSKQLQVHSL